MKYCPENRTVFINPTRKSVFIESASGGGDRGYLEHCVYTQGVPERLGSAAEMYFLTKKCSIFFPRENLFGRLFVIYRSLFVIYSFAVSKLLIRETNY